MNLVRNLNMRNLEINSVVTIAYILLEFKSKDGKNF